MNKKNPHPPKFGQWLLNKTIDKDIRYEALGDFHEIFYYMAEREGKLKAVVWYWEQVLKSLYFFMIDSIYWRFDMFKNYYKVAFRNLKRHKGYSFINISGLSIGICLFILIMLYVQNEFSYDKFNKKSDRIYLVEGGGEWNQSSMPPAIGKGIKENIPEAKEVVRFKFRHDYLAIHQSSDKSIQPRPIIIRDFGWADSSVFDVFTLPFIAGNPKTALKDPFSIVLTESIAKRIFQNKNPMGEIIKINDSYNYHVTGIMKDPKNFHLSFETLASFSTLGKTIGSHELDSFNSWNLKTYALLPQNHNSAAVSNKITDLFKNKLYEMYQYKLQFKLSPLTDLYFNNSGNGKHGNIQIVYIFVAIAIFILLIACINFINLSTARASLRAKEVGIKKVIGSSRNKLILQFLSESVLFSMVALTAALILVYILLPKFNSIIMKEISFNILNDPLTVIYLIAGIFIVGIISGTYPAFYLSSFSPNSVLKGEKTKGSGALLFRRLLIIFQFAITIILIIGTITVYQQLDFVKNKDLGFNKDFVINFDIYKNKSIRNNKEIFRKKLISNPNILNVAFSHGNPGRIYNYESFKYKDKNVGGAVFTIEPEYFDLYNIKITEGRSFDRELQTDELYSCIINETAVKVFELESPIGTILQNPSIAGSSFPSKEIMIIGIVKDFHLQSLHKKIKPLIFGWNDSWNGMASVKISSGSIPETINFIRDLWTEYSSEFPFEYSFFDESFNAQYNNEEQFGEIFSYFSLLGIFIACMGLFGLASFMAEQKTKELGIRKILGASTSGLVKLLSIDFLKWVLLANIFAWPLAYFVMNKWLMNFAYKINLNVFVFILSGIMALTIAFLTVSYQAVKAANSNPVEALKYE